MEPSSRTMVVGTGVRSYNSAYGYAALPVPGVRFVRAFRVPLNRLFPGSLTALHTYVPLDPRVDLLHLMNGVVAAGWPTPWVTSFESMLPRLDARHHGSRLDRRLVERLLDDRCRRLLAFSAYAVGWLSEQHPTEVSQRLLAKTEVFTGSTGPAATDPKVFSLPLKVAFVGGELLRKGGIAVVRAARACAQAGLPVEFTLVGQPEAATDVTPPACRYRDEFERLRRHASVIPLLDQAGVRTLLAESHVLLYPSLQETLGWVALEAMQRAVVPVVSGIAPLRELVGSAGFVVNLPLNKLGAWRGLDAGPEKRPREAAEALDELALGIEQTLAWLIEDPALYERRSAAALGEYVARFDPFVAGRRLRRIYDTALI